MTSSSSTLWATGELTGPRFELHQRFSASKEWVIQPKPKPGRKPKKDAAPTTLPEIDVCPQTSLGRRIQNRLRLLQP